MLEALYPPISAITHAGGDRVQFGVPPPVHPGHILFFSLHLLEFSEMSFENLNCCFQKDCKIPVLNLKNKIFIFHLKVKLERRVKAVIFSNWKRKPARDHVTEHSSCNPALPRLSSRGSTHTTVARGTALRDSHVGKPRGKASMESDRSLDPTSASVTLLLQLVRKWQVHAPTRDEE